MPGASHHLRRYPKDLWLPLVANAKAEGQYQPLVMCDSVLAEDWGLVEECAKLGVPLHCKGSLREFILLVSRAQRAWLMIVGLDILPSLAAYKKEFVFGLAASAIGSHIEHAT